MERPSSEQCGYTVSGPHAALCLWRHESPKSLSEEALQSWQSPGLQPRLLLSRHPCGSFPQGNSYTTKQEASALDPSRPHRCPGSTKSSQYSSFYRKGASISLFIFISSSLAPPFSILSKYDALFQTGNPSLCSPGSPSPYSFFPPIPTHTMGILCVERVCSDSL